MKRIGELVCAAMCCVVFSPLCMAQDSPAAPAAPAAQTTPATTDNPWNGSWKEDAATLKYDGPAFSIATVSDGFTVTRGGVAGPKIACDAGQNTMPDGTLTTCTTTENGYEVNSKKDGKPTNHVKISLSGDGKTLTRKVMVFDPDGSTYTITTRSTRVSGGPGLSGEWKAVSIAESNDTGVLSIKVDGDSVAFKETDQDKPVVCKLDGTPAKAGGSTIAIKPDGTQTLKVTYTGADGSVRRRNTFVMSADGTSIVETDVTPEPGASTTTLTLRKM
jgi:uncharacterized protein (DUF2147 family)